MLNTNRDRPQQVFGKESCKCAGDDQGERVARHFSLDLGQEQKGRDRFCLG